MKHCVSLFHRCEKVDPQNGKNTTLVVAKLANVAITAAELAVELSLVKVDRAHEHIIGMGNITPSTIDHFGLPLYKRSHSLREMRNLVTQANQLFADWEEDHLQLDVTNYDDVCTYQYSSLELYHFVNTLDIPTSLKWVVQSILLTWTIHGLHRGVTTVFETFYIIKPEHRGFILKYWKTILEMPRALKAVWLCHKITARVPISCAPEC